MEMSGNKVRTFSTRSDELICWWRTLHNEECHNSYYLLNVVRAIEAGRIRWKGHMEVIREIRNTYRILVEWPCGESPLGRPRSKWGV